MGLELADFAAKIGVLRGVPVVVAGICSHGAADYGFRRVLCDDLRDGRLARHRARGEPVSGARATAI